MFIWSQLSKSKVACLDLELLIKIVGCLIPSKVIVCWPWKLLLLLLLLMSTLMSLPPLSLLLSAGDWLRKASCEHLVPETPADDVPAYCRRLRRRGRTKATKGGLSVPISLHPCQSVTYRQRPVSRSLMLKCRMVSWRWLPSAAVANNAIVV